jgi:hypothetical protein
LDDKERSGLADAIPLLIENGVLLERDVSKEGGLSNVAKRKGVKEGRSHILYSPARIAGRDFIARVLVSERFQGDTLAYVATAVELDGETAGSVRGSLKNYQRTSGDLDGMTQGQLFGIIKRIFDVFGGSRGKCEAMEGKKPKRHTIAWPHLF